MSSPSSFGSQHRPHALSMLLSSLIQGEKEDTRVWLRHEMDRLVDPMVDSIFQRINNKLVNTHLCACRSEEREDGDDRAQVANLFGQNVTANAEVQEPAFLICQPSSTPTSVISHFNAESHQPLSIGYEPEIDPEILAEVKREIEEENEMDNTSQANQQFGQQVEDCDLNRIQSEDGGNRAQIMNPFEHVELTIPQPSFNSHSLLSNSSGYEPENDPEILAEVKREIEEENEMELQNAMDNTSLANQQIEDLNHNQIVDNDEDCDQLLNQFEHVESAHTQLAKLNVPPATTTFNLDSKQPSFGYEPENDPAILAEVKREIKEEYEMALQNVMDNTSQANKEEEVADGISRPVGHIFQHSQQTYQVNSGSSTHDPYLTHNTDLLTLVEDGMQLGHQGIFDDNNNQVLDGPVNNATDDDTQQDCDQPEIKEFDDEQSNNDGEIEIEEEADGNDDLEEEDGDEDTEIDSDNDGGVEDNQHEESSRSVESVAIASSPHPNGQSQSIVRRSVTFGKRTHDEQQSNEVNIRDNPGGVEVDEKDDVDDSEVTFRSVKRSRPSTSSSTHDKIIITLSLRCPEGCADPIAQDQFSKHMKEKHSLGSYRCAVKDCGQTFVNRYILGMHVQHVHQHITQWDCDKCSSHFSNYNALSNHTSNLHRLGHFQCSFASCKFTGECKMKMYNHHNQQHKPDLVCPQSGCHFRTKDITIFKAHERSHLGSKPYQCKWPDCHYSCASRKTTLNHIQQKHFKSRWKVRSRPDLTQLGKAKDYIEFVG